MNYTIQCTDQNSGKTELDKHSQAYEENAMREANARLIASAPTLLEACKFALESGDDLEAINKLKAAIKLAQGDSHE